MSAKTTIEWTDRTWNPIRGCSLVSAGCTHCYAMKQAHRFHGPGQPYEGLTRLGPNGPVWTGKIKLVEDALLEPLHWKKPQRVFVNSMSDLFHDGVPDSFIDRVFAVMALCPQHTFQVLTKRPERMEGYLNDQWVFSRIDAAAKKLRSISPCHFLQQRDWPLPNVHLGVSVEDQETADLRIPPLLRTPAAVRWVSYEPALGPVDFSRWIDHWHDPEFGECQGEDLCPGWRKLDSIVMGGESGPGARPMHPEWARAVRDQCQAAGVAFFFKQWGAYLPPGQASPEVPFSVADQSQEATTPMLYAKGNRVGKSRAGRLLDGVEHNALPGVRG